MTILNQLASSFNRRDEGLNQELAGKIVETADKIAIKELVDNLANKNKAIQNDCIKVLYEIGALKPRLIAGYVANFLDLLNHKNNRLQWGGMTALNCISTVRPKNIYDHLQQIMDAADKGSVITRDHAVNILINLATVPQYSEDAFGLLVEQLLKSPTNQLAMYAERSLPIINERNQKEFMKALNARLADIEKDSKRKRLEKVIKRLTK